MKSSTRSSQKKFEIKETQEDLKHKILVKMANATE